MQNSASTPNGETVTGTRLTLLGTAVAALVWSYWPTLATLAHRWSIDPQYSHGFIVPLVAVGLIWFRRDVLSDRHLSPSWLGLPLIGLAIGMRLAGARFYFEALDWLSLLPSVAGICLLIGGWSAWRCAWPGILFLSFMLPLPYRVETMLGRPLQSVATLASTFSLQTLGFPAIAEGNLIRIDETTISVAEACSGLRMLVVFFAVSTAVAIVVNRTIWERGLIIASAVPVAILCNVVRITLTGVLFETVGNAWAKLVFHDFAGWLMMILALAALRIELWLLDHTLIEPPPRDVIPVLSQRSLDDSPASVPTSNLPATTAVLQTSAPVEEPAEEIAAV
jgi:exosortase